MKRLVLTGGNTFIIFLLFDLDSQIKTETNDHLSIRMNMGLTALLTDRGVPVWYGNLKISFTS